MKCLNYLGHIYPCGKCMACRINRQREKQLRLSHQQQYAEKSVFLTLTYNDDNLPKGGTLVKKDLQDFFKRFRKRLSPTLIKYFACGEYGDHTQRPHYHAIIYNVGMRDSRVFVNLRYVPSKSLYYCDCKAWSFGHVTVAVVNDARCSYVAKYCTKKITGDMAEKHYNGREPEFCLSSQGIGLDWALEHAKQLVKDGCVYVRGKPVQIPRYYLDKVFTEKEKWERHKRIIAEQEKKSLEEFNEHLGEDLGKFRRESNEARIKFMAKKIQKKGVRNEV